MQKLSTRSTKSISHRKQKLRKKTRKYDKVYDAKCKSSQKNCVVDAEVHRKIFFSDAKIFKEMRGSRHIIGACRQILTSYDIIVESDFCTTIVCYFFYQVVLTSILHTHLRVCYHTLFPVRGNIALCARNYVYKIKLGARR